MALVLYTLEIAVHLSVWTVTKVAKLAYWIIVDRNLTTESEEMKLLREIQVELATIRAKQSKDNSVISPECL
jgi:hypothetical protein